MPKLFYKFVKDDAEHKVVKSFCQGKLKFSRIPDLNDSSEEFVTTNLQEYRLTLKKILNNEYATENGNIQRQADIDTLKKHIKLVNKIYPSLALEENVIIRLLERLPELAQGKGLLNILQRGVVLPNGLNFEMMFNLLTNLLKELHQSILSKVGIFCVSECVDFIPMWAHYADNAQGFAVEFKDLDNYFNGDNGETDVFHVLKPVEYSGGCRPAVPLEPSNLDEIFFSKLDHWEYEREYRVVELLSSCKIDCKGNYLYEMQRQCVSRIIVGWKCTDDRFEEIKKVCGDIEVTRARLNNYGNIELDGL